jgi:hypothetical protein
MMTPQQEMSQDHADNHYHHTFIKKHVCRQKQKPVKAQKTALTHSQCTVAQQFWWFVNKKH